MRLIDRITMGQYGQPRGCTISFAPEDMSEGGGGLLDDVDVTFLALKCRTSEGTPYDKGNSKIIPLLQVDMLPDGTEDVQTQYYSCGDLANWRPSPDGETLIDVKNTGGSINKSTNAAMFLVSLVQAGIPSEKLKSNKVSDLAGIKAHMVRTKRPKDNIKRAEGAREPEVLTVQRIISVPWGTVTTGVAASPVVASKGQGVATTAAQQGNGHTKFGDADLATLAMNILMENGGTLPKVKLMQEVYKAALGGAVPVDATDDSGKPARSTVGGKIGNDQFLGSQPFWRYDGGVVTLV